MSDLGIQSTTTKERINRCVEWLKEQNNPKKLSLQNKNDIQFIIETNAHRKKFFLTAEDDATVPVGVGEVEVEPKNVPVRRLRHEQLCLECEWPLCREFFSNYLMFQVHVTRHLADVHVIENNGQANYVCLWDVCGHKTSDKRQMVRHINYHAYHAKLLAIGLNARATFKLERCKKDSSKRNQLPPLLGDHCCMWFQCTEYFDSMQISTDEREVHLMVGDTSATEHQSMMCCRNFRMLKEFLDHVKAHIDSGKRSGVVCSWAGCGAKFDQRRLLHMHVRVHTGERLVACYHCGTHFALNRKLCDHLLRQNVDPSAGHKCSVCGEYFASQYLLREHVRRHVSCYACSLCDMSQPTPADLAHHVRYRHMAGEDVRRHACPDCDYRAVTKYDLRAHLKIHNRKRKKSSDASDDSDGEVKKKKVAKKYICHMCPDNKPTTFARGQNLTTHLVKLHGAQWPCGHSRFRYQKSEDGMYRLTTTRFEVLEVSKKIVDGYRGPKATLSNKYDFNIKKVADCTATTPRRYEISIKNTIKTDSEQGKEESERNTRKKEEQSQKEENTRKTKKNIEPGPKERSVKKPRKDSECQTEKVTKNTVKKEPGKCPKVNKKRKRPGPRKEKVTRKKKATKYQIDDSPNKEDTIPLKQEVLSIKQEEMQYTEEDLTSEEGESQIEAPQVKNEIPLCQIEDVKHIETESEDIEEESDTEECKRENNALEIEMCDVDEEGNVLNSETIQSEIIYSYFA